MTLTDLASLGSFVSALAVLVSLVYLAIQVRQSERNQRSAIGNQTYARATDLVLRLGESPLADIYRRMLSRETEFSETEVLQMLNILYAFIFLAADDLGLRQDALISRTTTELNRNTIRFLFSCPIPRALWPMLRGQMPAALLAFIEGEMRDVAISPPISFAEQLKRNLQR